MNPENALEFATNFFNSARAAQSEWECPELMQVDDFLAVVLMMLAVVEPQV